MSILEVAEHSQHPDHNNTTQHQDNNGDIISNQVQNIVPVRQNNNLNTPRGRGRPRGTRRRTPLTLQEEDRRRRETLRNETPERRQIRREQQVLRRNNFLNNETPQATANRLQSQAVRQANNRANETDEQHQQRLDYQNNYNAENNQVETPEQRLQRLGLVYERRNQARFLAPTYNKWKVSSNAAIEMDDQGHLDNECPFCGALFWEKEVNSRGIYTKCCERDKIRVPIIREYHRTMIRLLDKSNRNPQDMALRKEFLHKIRDYNAQFSVASVNCQFDRADLDNSYNDANRLNARGNYLMPYLFKVHDAVYYRVPPMFNGPNGRQNLRAAQYLMLDSDRAMLEHRINNWRDFNGPVNPVVSLKL